MGQQIDANNTVVFFFNDPTANDDGQTICRTEAEAEVFVADNHRATNQCQ